MYRSLRRVGLAVTAAVALVVLASPAFAATWTVKIGSTTTGAGTYTAASSGNVTLKDFNTGSIITCTSVSMGGAVPHLGSGQSGTGVLTVTSSSWTCTGTLLPSLTITPTGTWKLNLTSASGVVSTGFISGVSMNVTATTCSYTLTGAMDVKFNSASQVLSAAAVGGSGHVLTISGVSGCFSQWSNGNTLGITGSLTVAATTPTTPGALTFASP